MTLMSTVDAEPENRRRSALPVALAVVAVVALLAGVGGIAAARRRTAPAADATDALFFDWPARGSLAGDEAAVDQAVEVWNEAWGPPDITHPHSHVSVLYAERLDIGDFFALQGLDEHGVAKLGFVFVPPGAPSWNSVPAEWPSFSLPLPALTNHLTCNITTNMAGDHAKLVVIGEPGVTTVEYSDVDHPDVVKPAVVQDGVGIADMVRGTTRVIVGTAGGTIYDGPVDGGHALNANTVRERPEGGTTPMPIVSTMEP